MDGDIFIAIWRLFFKMDSLRTNYFHCRMHGHFWGIYLKRTAKNNEKKPLKQWLLV
jgi:hypothetical protein